MIKSSCFFRMILARGTIIVQRRWFGVSPFFLATAERSFAGRLLPIYPPLAPRWCSLCLSQRRCHGRFLVPVAIPLRSSFRRRRILHVLVVKRLFVKRSSCVSTHHVVWNGAERNVFSTRLSQFVHSGEAVQHFMSHDAKGCLL